MKKNIILIIVLTILSTIYVVLSYTGVIRYANMYRRSSYSFVESHNHLDKASGDERVVVSLTVTSNEDMEKIKPVINSLLDQTLRPTKIALTAPYSVNVPKSVSDVVSVYRYSKDYGTLSPFIPVLLREKEANTKILVVDPKHVYSSDCLEKMLKRSEGKSFFINMSTGVYLIEPRFFTGQACEIKDKNIILSDWFKENGDKNLSFKFQSNYRNYKLF
jgi:hypothetical protein